MYIRIVKRAKASTLRVNNPNETGRFPLENRHQNCSFLRCVCNAFVGADDIIIIVVFQVRKQLAPALLTLNQESSNGQKAVSAHSISSSSPLKGLEEESKSFRHHLSVAHHLCVHLSPSLPGWSVGAGQESKRTS